MTREIRPSNCRNRLRDEGKPYPRSGCSHCGRGGLTGCPYDRVIKKNPAASSPPLPRLDPVVEAVRADLHRRSQFGVGKYGTTLADNPAAHRAKLQHAYEECLDAANYLKWAMLEIDRNDGSAPCYMYGVRPAREE